MAKHTKQAIFETADRLVEAGKNPTLANVREAMGGGSFTTISQAMTEWKTKQAAETQTLKEAAPDAITSRVGELSAEIWAVAQEMANARLSNEREALEQNRLGIEASQKEAIDLADQLSSDLETLQSAYNKMVGDVKSANELLEARMQTNLGIQKQLDAAEIRIEESNARMEDLRGELKQAHETARAQREQHSKDTKQLNEKLIEAQQTASDSRAAAARLEGELKQVQEEISIQRKQHGLETAQLNEKLDDVQKVVNDRHIAAARLEEALKHAHEKAVLQAKQHTNETKQLTEEHNEAVKKLTEQLAETVALANDSREAAEQFEGELKALKKPKSQ